MAAIKAGIKKYIRNFLLKLFIKSEKVYPAQLFVTLCMCMDLILLKVTGVKLPWSMLLFVVLNLQMYYRTENVA